MAQRKADRRRAAREASRHLEDLPRQFGALENAMAAFGDDFDLATFKAAYETSSDLDAYNRVQALERAVGRVQNYVGELAIAGAQLADLPPSSGGGGGAAARAFEALRDAEIIDRGLCRRLVQAQGARTRIEHGYLDTPAGDVHRTAVLVRTAARDFLGPYRAWIGPYLEKALAGD